jgi:hypothetical protein
MNFKPSHDSHKREEEARMDAIYLIDGKKLSVRLLDLLQLPQEVPGKESSSELS